MDRDLRRRPDGFLERGCDVTRVEAFVDAAFAFAVTVLVVNVFDGVGSANQLRAALALVPSLIASFAVLMMFWWAHQTWSRRYGLDDGWSIVLSLGLVFVVALYVYPLQLMFQSGLAWMSRLLLPPAWFLPWGMSVETGADVVTMFWIYGVAWVVLGLLVTGLYWRAWAQRESLGLEFEEVVRTRVEIARWLWVPATGVLALALTAWLGPRGDWTIGLAGLAYSAMGLTGVVQTLAERRVRRRLGPEPPR